MKSVGALCGVVLMAAMIFGGCNDSTAPDVITIQDLSGTWTASSFVYTAVSNPALQVDLIDAGGSFVMIITATGAFTGTTIYPPMGTRTYTGMLALSGSTLTQDFDDGDIPTLTWTMSGFDGDSFMMTGGQGPFDFTDNDVDDLVNASISATVHRL